ncbi:MAG: NTP transferase domain-containing protein [Peptococcaceae bacterium]|nr:NTP transferase domain-containing protein [Peptococcaceae bacterium]
MINALVLAGSKNDGPLSQSSEVPFEAMIPIGSKMMTEYVVDALRGAKGINQIIVVGPAEIAKYLQQDDVRVIPANNNIIDNIQTGFSALPDTEKILIVTCDIPLLTPQAIEDFVARCGDQSRDVYYPIIPREIIEKGVFKTERTYVTFREGQFTGGNIFLVDPKKVKDSFEKSRRIVDARKSPFRLSKMLGIGFLAKFIMRRVSLAEAEKKVSNLLSLWGKVVVTEYPELGVDVDKPSDLKMVAEILTSRQKGLH